MTLYKIFEEIENNRYFLDATHPDIPNWSKTIRSSEIFGNIEKVIEFIHNRIDELIYDQKNMVEIKRNGNEFNFEYNTLLEEENERNENKCKIYYVEQ